MSITDSGKILLSQLKFEGNAALLGGGLYIEYSQVGIEDSHFDANEADYGGAIAFKAARRKLTIGKVNFSDNEAYGVNGGGAIYAQFDHGNNVPTDLSKTSLVFTNGFVHTGNKALNDQGKILRIEFKSTPPTMDNAKKFLDIGSSGLDLDDASLVFIEL